MVVFTCGHCGESLQKPKVEKHYLTKCRNRNPNLSCMDCFKDFLGKDYEVHTKCVTEEERYSGKGFQAKEKKGEKKQNAWVEMLQSVLDEQKNAPRNVLRIIESITKHNNTPRKKPKFINFVKNVCGHKTNASDIEQAWDLISVKLAALSNVNNQNKKEEQTGEQKECNGHINGNLKTGNNTNESDTEEQSTNQENNDEVEEKHQNGTSERGNKKKMSKKERKEEKKRLKYETELQSAAAPLELEEQEPELSKKGKKKKNKSESNGQVEDKEEVGGKNGKNKKRKRQDTVNSTGAQEAVNEEENIENVPINKEKIQKKKQKIDGESDDENEQLHNQNVAKIEELSMKSENFDWHSVIISVLEKKDNELPFKRLQKKVLMEYSEATGREVDDRIADKFIKKLKSAPNVKVDKNRVLLLN